MPHDPFFRQIRLALANPHLQSALDANAIRRQKARLSAYSALPGGVNAWRRRAHAVRLDTITHLDEHLEAFIQSASRAGWQVHSSSDSAQAVETILKIARDRGSTRIAKSKTMLGEEIGLNPALEAVGLDVVETDLGEWIVQLRGEHPAHIITPAVHLTRADVGRTFSEKLGIPYNDDVLSLTATAREALRSTFLNAEIGITGANFGIVDTGQICLVSNEGNARMVSTLPPVHIALLGIERLVPNLDALALMLALLPRAASGLKSTVYTSLIGAPQQTGESEGPKERHLILIDNGRSSLRSSPLAEALLCIRCGACLNACPIFRELGGHAYVSRKGELSPYPGPIGQVLAPALFGPDFNALAHASSLCGACREACPVDIDLPSLLLRVRAGRVTPDSGQTKNVTDKELSRPGDQIGPVSSATGAQREQEDSPTRQKEAPTTPAVIGWGLRLYTFFATSSRRFAFAQRLAGRFGRIFSFRGTPGWLRLPAFTGWGLRRDLPAPDPRPFRRRWAALHASRQDNSKVKAFSPADQITSSEKAEKDQMAYPITEDVNGSSSLLERFVTEAAERACQVSICSSVELADRLISLLRERSIPSLLTWEAPHLPSGLLEALGQAGLSLTHTPNPHAQAGLTGAQAGIAETGALALIPGPGRPQTASLLPEIHIAILDARKIYPNLQAFFRQQDRLPALTLISGPSRTADIEMTLTVGVHGPKEVHIYCLTD